VKRIASLSFCVDHDHFSLRARLNCDAEPVLALNDVGGFDEDRGDAAYPRQRLQLLGVLLDVVTSTP